MIAIVADAGADVDAVEAANRTALHIAVERGDLALVHLLLAKKASTKIRDRNGWTPLHHAAAKDRLEIARALLDAKGVPYSLIDIEAVPGAREEMRARSGRTSVPLISGEVSTWATRPITGRSPGAVAGTVAIT